MASGRLKSLLLICQKKKSLLLRPLFGIKSRRVLVAARHRNLRVRRYKRNTPLPRFEGPGLIFQTRDRDIGDDHNHWMIKVKEPVGSRDEIIEGYVELVAQVLGSEDEARKKIYSVSTKYYFAVCVLVVSRGRGVQQLPDVEEVIEDCYVDLATKDYGGEPFIDGKPVPYDPKHHDLYHRVQARVKAVKKRRGPLF